eukprot:scaffold310_cov302-Prasinococcus_capsulatus_cf.AAC.9
MAPRSKCNRGSGDSSSSSSSSSSSGWRRGGAGAQEGGGLPRAWPQAAAPGNLARRCALCLLTWVLRATAGADPAVSLCVRRPIRLSLQPSAALASSQEHRRRLHVTRRSRRGSDRPKGPNFRVLPYPVPPPPPPPPPRQQQQQQHG